jgi:hypothetical protein
MGLVDDFSKELRRNTKNNFAAWHKIDLHNHTPRSFDYRYPGNDLLDKLTQRIFDSDLSVVMFTDHEQLPEKVFTDELQKRTNRLILRGVELNVFVDAFGKPESKVNKDVFYHLLVGFDPAAEYDPEYWLQQIYRGCGKETRQIGGRDVVGITAHPDQLLEVLRGSNAIIIPAHLHTVNNPLTSRSVDDIFSDPIFLKHTREAFTALEVRESATADFFDGKHMETNYLHMGCVRSSDSHEPDELGRRFSYVQLERLTYDELKAALELPFRTLVKEPEIPESYITGVRIRGRIVICSLP